MNVWGPSQMVKRRWQWTGYVSPLSTKVSRCFTNTTLQSQEGSIPDRYRLRRDFNNKKRMKGKFFAARQSHSLRLPNHQNNNPSSASKPRSCDWMDRTCSSMSYVNAIPLLGLLLCLRQHLLHDRFNISNQLWPKSESDLGLTIPTI